jgi:hypothetical protein
MTTTVKPPRKKAGRKPKLVLDEATKRMIRGVGAIGASFEELAVALSVNRDTLYEFMDREPTVRELFESGRDVARMKLRRLQWKTAESNGKGAATMQIWLGKQLLNQKDKHELGGPDGEPLVAPVVNIQFVPSGHKVGITKPN